MANFAFPELHPKVARGQEKRYFLITFQAKLKAEPENLILLTQTKTDSHGRRHSVAIPLIPPPDGEKFEGGYHIERNPINGAARLVHPSKGGQFLFWATIFRPWHEENICCFSSTFFEI